jgi:hypothetical protein
MGLVVKGVGVVGALERVDEAQSTRKSQTYILLAGAESGRNLQVDI